jgi:hypothetical protein
MTSPDILIALKLLTKTFNKLSIPYYIGGSLASSIYGMPRTTLDVDIAADIDPNKIQDLKNNLEKEYYIDENMIKNAINDSSSFNLIHLETSIKIDVFAYKDNTYQKNAIKRRREDTLFENDKKSKFCFASPEDIILNKLIWYRMGDETSERQWLDITGVIKVQGNSLDKTYLKKWARNLKLIKLLKKAFMDSKIKFE